MKFYKLILLLLLQYSSIMPVWWSCCKETPVKDTGLIEASNLSDNKPELASQKKSSVDLEETTKKEGNLNENLSNDRQNSQAVENSGQEEDRGQHSSHSPANNSGNILQFLTPLEQIVVTSAERLEDNSSPVQNATPLTIVGSEKNSHLPNGEKTEAASARNLQIDLVGSDSSSSQEEAQHSSDKKNVSLGKKSGEENVLEDSFGSDSVNIIQDSIPAKFISCQKEAHQLDLNTKQRKEDQALAENKKCHKKYGGTHRKHLRNIESSFMVERIHSQLENRICNNTICNINNQNHVLNSVNHNQSEEETSESHHSAPCAASTKTYNTANQTFSTVGTLGRDNQSSLKGTMSFNHTD